MKKQTALLIVLIFASLITIQAQTNFTFEKVFLPKGSNTWGYFVINDNNTIATIVKNSSHVPEFYISKNRGTNWIKQSNISKQGHDYTNIRPFGDIFIRSRGYLETPRYNTIYVSDDRGKTWEKQSTLPKGYQRCEYIDKDTKYCATTDRGFKGYTICEYEDDQWKATHTVGLGIFSIELGREQNAPICEDCYYKPDKFNSYAMTNYRYVTANYGAPIYSIAKRKSEGKIWVSHNDGEEWEELIPPAPHTGFHRLSRICKEGLLFVTTPIPNEQSFVSEDGGKSWKEISLPNGEVIRDVIQYAPDGTIYVRGQNDTVYRSIEKIGCGSGNSHPQESICELTMEDFPRLSPITRILPANTKGKFSTGVHVKKGDYVCVVANGEAAIKYNTKVQQVVYENELKISPIGHTDPENLQRLNDFKKHSEHYLGQVIISLDEKIYSCNKFTLKDDDCDYIPDEFLLQTFTFSNLYGDYFISENDGILELELNHANPENNIGQFDIEIYKLTAKQHKYRNCFNKCPKKKPSLINTGISYKDNNEYLWNDYTTFPNIDILTLSPNHALDAIIERCYHPEADEFRGQSSIVKGCQCAYDDDTKEFVNNADDSSLRLGTFDYGYINIKEDNLRLHFILDVFPHVIYAQDKSFRYAATPTKNIY